MIEMSCLLQESINRRMSLWSVWTTTVFCLLCLCSNKNAWGWQQTAMPATTATTTRRATTVFGAGQSQRRKRRRETTALHISNIFGGDSPSSSSKQLPTLPRNVKDAVSACRQATQEALQKKISRMDIEFPVGAKFNVEPTPKRKRGGSGGGDPQAPLKSDLDRSDRELARLFVDMFQPVGGDRITVVYKDAQGADEAKKKWRGDATGQCFITSIDRRKKAGGGGKKKNKKAKSKGFAAKLAAEVGGDDDDDGNNLSSGPFRLPDNTEVALFVAPGPKELLQVERICEKVGMGTLVVLLNARLSTISNFGTPTAAKLFTEDFESVFHLAAAPQDVAPNCLLYRSYPGDWVLARKPSVGQPKTILSQPTRPTSDECLQAFESLELSDVERGVENVVQNVAEWLS